jgi:hypothetical protein
VSLRRRPVLLGGLLGGLSACASPELPPAAVAVHQDAGRPPAPVAEAPPTIEAPPVFTEPLQSGSGEGSTIANEELLGTAAPPRARPRAVVQGPAVPRQLVTLQRDYAAVPIAGTPVVAKGETVAFKETSTSVAVVMARGLVSEIEVGPHRFFLNMAGNGFTGATGTSLGAGARFLCVGTPPTTARWRGFVPAGLKAGSLDFSELRGELDPFTCVAEATTRLDVRASALIPQTLYAFRRCDGRCDEGFGAERLETLTLVAPPSSFVLASDAKPDDMTNPHVGTFTVLEIPVAPDRAASGTIRLPISAFARLTTLSPGVSLGSVVGASGIELDVEVVGPTPRGDAPTLSVHVSALVEPTPSPGAPAPLNTARLRGFRAP